MDIERLKWIGANIATDVEKDIIKAIIANPDTSAIDIGFAEVQPAPVDRFKELSGDETDAEIKRVRAQIDHLEAVLPELNEYVTLDELDAELDEPGTPAPPPDELVEALLAVEGWRPPLDIVEHITKAVRQLSHAYELLYCAADEGHNAINEVFNKNLDIHAAAHITAAKVEELAR